jgi:hypothetical protein
MLRDEITGLDGTILNRRNIGIKQKEVGVGSARSITYCIKPAVHQVVFSDVQITIRQRIAVLPVLEYWSELCSYWLTQNRRFL